MTNGVLSRRDFLKLSGAALLSLFLSELHPAGSRAAALPLQGRVVYRSLIVRNAPSFTGKQVGSVLRDSLLDIIGQGFGGVDGDYNRLWYRLGDDRYVYSGGVQPVVTLTNPIASEIPSTGVLGEITIPFADSVWGVNRSPSPGPRLYYGTTHWVDGLVTDQRDGSLWYKAYDNLYNSHYFTRPAGIHLFSPAEISPLSAQVPEIEKHIEIVLDRQVLLAFEWNVLVYAARVATGQKNFESPTGWFRTFHKRPTYHMTGGADEFSVFDLPGVPWDSYITDGGVAIHGTYWHNDFGHPHSHGCINMAPQDAKWIYRWTLPAVPSGERLVLQPGVGTRVLISQS
jgi:L,D-transpeptidase catalytic domain